MPFPAILGVGFLSGLLGNLFAQAVQFFTKRVGKIIAFRIVFTGLVIGMMVVFIGVCELALSTIAVVLPAEFETLLVNILPDNTSGCLAAIITVNVARRIYDYKVKQASLTYLGI